MIRPEAKDALWRWRECLAALPLALLGLYWTGGFGILRWLGVATLLFAVALAFTGVQRVRFRRPETGAGVVIIAEDELTYMGPNGGASLARDQIIAVDKTPGAWILTGRDGTRLVIPPGAKGAEQLFDIFTRLPNFPIELALRAASDDNNPHIMIWAREISARTRLS